MDFNDLLANASKKIALPVASQKELTIPKAACFSLRCAEVAYRVGSLDPDGIVDTVFITLFGFHDPAGSRIGGFYPLSDALEALGPWTPSGRFYSINDDIKHLPGSNGIHMWISDLTLTVFSKALNLKAADRYKTDEDLFELYGFPTSRGMPLGPSSLNWQPISLSIPGPREGDDEIPPDAMVFLRVALEPMEAKLQLAMSGKSVRAVSDD